MTLTIKLDGNWISFQLANNTPPLSVTGSVIAPSARMPWGGHSLSAWFHLNLTFDFICLFDYYIAINLADYHAISTDPWPTNMLLEDSERPIPINKIITALRKHIWEKSVPTKIA